MRRSISVLMAAFVSASAYANDVDGMFTAACAEAISWARSGKIDFEFTEVRIDVLPWSRGQWERRLAELKLSRKKIDERLATFDSGDNRPTEYVLYGTYKYKGLGGVPTHRRVRCEYLTMKSQVRFEPRMVQVDGQFPSKP